jgi:uncharacterized repeat protein (TIGR02543 family)
MLKFVGRSLATVVAISLVFSGPNFPASAAPGDGITLYISAPLVQGSEVSGTGSLSDDFNSYSTGACPASTAVGTLDTSPTSSACLISNAQTYGGASSISASPAFGGSGSRFPATPYPAQGTITVTFPNPVKYVGFWWSAGNAGNTVEFLNGSTVVASLETSALASLLGSTPPSSWPSGNGTVTSLGGTDYPKGRYFGNPRGFTNTTPDTASTVDPTAQFLYLNLYLQGSITATAVRLSGNGFEFDNMTTSTVQQAPSSTMVFVKSVLGKSVQFLPAANDATGSMSAQSETTTSNLTSNAFNRPGYTFTGWNTREDGQGTPYANGASYSFTSDLTLYAQWEVAPSPSPTPSPTASPSASSTPAPVATAAPGGGTVNSVSLATTGTSETAWILPALAVSSLGIGLLVFARRRLKKLATKD